MVNWRELGEVPDSEEEDNGLGFDSEGSQSWLADDPLLLAEKQKKDIASSNTANRKDVWDIPSSQEDELAQPALTNQFRHREIRLSTPPPRPPTSYSLDSPLSSLSASSPILPPAETPGSPSVPGTQASEPTSQLRDQHDQEPPRIVIHTSPPASPGLIANNTQSPVQPLPPIQSQILGHDAEQEEARMAAVHYERSLRARRPEQLRPYFTERTRFNNEWRQHGLRPVRITTENEERQRSKSPEESYEPESQESGLQRVEDESQSFNTDEGMGRVFGNLASSSPVSTSPLYRHRGGPSSQLSQQTDETSVAWDDLPSIQELASKTHRSSATKRLSKRKSSLTYSTKSKRSKEVSEEDVAPAKFIFPPSSPPRPFATAPDPSRRPNQADSPNPDPFSFPDDDGALLPEPMDFEFDQTPSRAALVPVESSESETEAPRHGLSRRDDQVISSDESSGSESEIVHQNSKRIKGVLPASWLRLDQQYGRDKVQKKMTGTQRNVSPEREQRRGLAQRRFIKTASRTDAFLFDDSDDDEARPRVQKTTDDMFPNQTTLPLEPVAISRPVHDVSSDSEGSVVEEDVIDRMLPPSKRQLKIADSFGQPPKPRKPPTKTGLTKPPRQPRIDTALGHPSTAIPRKSQPAGKTRKPRSKHPNGQRKAPKPKTPQRRAVPQLSILDVIEPDAPRFLKIAARTAKRRPDQGRGSPSRKTIQLATRNDHVDACSVLNDWRAGSIAQRQSVSTARKARQSQPRQRAQPLGERHANATPRPRRDQTSLTGPRKLARHVSAGGRVSYGASRGERSPRKTMPQQPSSADNAQVFKVRPAQLEIENDEPSRFAFHSGKNLLDRLWRSKYGSSSIAGSVFSEPLSETPRTAVHSTLIYDHGRTGESVSTVLPPKQPRERKKRKPKRVDLDQPQYSHAHDPLPTARPQLPDVEASNNHVGDSKLLGLGPYGTTYSQHFEMFPLDQGVYFNDSTLLGSGAVETALNWVAPRQDEEWPSVSFMLEEKMLHWGSWNAQVSSEFGICLDFVSEQLYHPSPDTASRTLAVANHLFNYVTKHLSFSGEGDAKSFITRMLDILPSFTQRVQTCKTTLPSSHSVLLQLIPQILDRLLLVMVSALQLCRCDPSTMSEQFQVEDVLKSAAKLAMSALYDCGLGQLREQYKNLARARAREHGIRDDTPLMQSWVVLMQVLDMAQIPRGSFWDVAQDVLVPSRITTSYDVHDFERIWEDLFTLLPLTEFNNAGVLANGRRHEIVKDGWTIPLKLLRRIFDIYSKDSRQHPSFNNYCRAILGRCHYLVEQWGWRRCSAVVGQIFDFFGSHDLAHLRNEEFYDSPQFLHDLPRQPSLSISPEDRSFHIFLKLLALAIRKLSQAGLVKDVRNLVARTVPNHSRQFLKEQTIHERDLAALRNHHDLLCTLYWATPSDLRPSVGLIERLVVPSSSHKEACLINFRAWSQLARYVVSSGEATTSFKPFHLWRQEFFQQMMEQFNSVAHDIEQQFKGLSKDVSKSISEDMISAMVTTNRAAIQDVVYFAVAASLDVIKHAPDLEAAMFSLSTSQLQQVFKHFTNPQPELDWATLRGCLSILDVFLSHVDEFKDNEESQQSESRVLDSAQADDALLTLDHDVAESFFSMVRTVLSGGERKRLSLSATADRASCVEQVIVLGARLVVRFTGAGVMSLADVFGRKKYGIFQDVPHRLGLDQRRYLTLFIATLLEHGFNSFNASSASFSLLDLWVLSLVKPRQALAHENRLAEQLVRRGEKFVPEAAGSLAITPAYHTNRDLFEFAISTMRKDIREAGPSLKKILKQEYGKTLRLVMEQVRNDLKTTVDENLAEHPRYVSFVHDIVALIREHGGDVCQVDVFFYQISKEYSPSAEDPQLLVAGMMSYGMGLSEGDVRAGHELFFFLYNNVKQALNTDNLGDEVRFLQKGMKGNGAIFQFVLGKLLPAVIRAVVAVIHGEEGERHTKLISPLLDVYVEALRAILAGDIAPRQLTADECRPMLAALRAVFEGLAGIGAHSGLLSDEKLHVAVQLYQIMNILWPSVYMMMVNADTSSPSWDKVYQLLQYCGSFNRLKESSLAEAVDLGITQLDANGFLGIKRADYVEPPRTSAEDKRDEQYIASFAQSITADVKRSWVVTEAGRISTQQTPGRALGSTQATTTPATQVTAAQGIGRREWGEGDVVRELYDCVREWNHWWRRVYGGDDVDMTRKGRIERAVAAVQPFF